MEKQSGLEDNAVLYTAYFAIRPAVASCRLPNALLVVELVERIVAVVPRARPHNGVCRYIASIIAGVL